MDSRLNHVTYFPNSKYLNLSFITIIVINTIFFSGYVILKDPLAYILFSEGIPLKQAYSITTTANILLAMCSIFFGFLMNDCGRQKHALLLGTFLCVLSLVLLGFKNYTLTLIAINFYVLGGGLYFFNIVIFLNRLFDHHDGRIKCNYIYQIFTNAGAFIGFILFLTQLNHDNVFKYSLISGIASLVVFTFMYKWIDDGPQLNNNYRKFYTWISVLFGLIFIALRYEEATRICVAILFIIGVIYTLLYAYKEKNKNLLHFMALIFFFSLPFWISSTIFFSEFFYFLQKDVKPILGVTSASYLILIDPFVNMVFGMALLFWQGRRDINSYNNLSISSLLLLAAFLVLSVGLFLDKNVVKIAIIYPLITLVLFACSEFLLLTTLNATIRELLPSHQKSEFFATGITRASRSFASVFGYFLIAMTASKPGNLGSELSANFDLFSIMVMIFIGSYSGFFFYKKNILFKQKAA